MFDGDGQALGNASHSAANSDARARLLVEKLIWTRSASEMGSQ